MQKDERDLLEVLKFELQFLEHGGYGRSQRMSWRPQYIFEDSLTCMTYDSKENPGPCSDCVLMQLVPPECRSEKIPCRHIPFNTSGETLDSLHRYSNQQETEETVGGWLRATIQRLEEERAVARQARSKTPARWWRNVERNPSVPETTSQVCKPGVSDCLSLDRRRQVLPIPARSGGNYWE